MSAASSKEISVAGAGGGITASTLESVLLGGDLERLSSEQRLSYLYRVCESLDLNPLTRPFQYVKVRGENGPKTILYATKDATEQLRSKRAVSVTIASREEAAGCYVVTARATLPSGRTDESIGAVNIEGLKGESRSNAMMKAETKAKRRVTLSICGLGILDESEVDSVPGAQRVTFETVPAAANAPAAVPAPKPAEVIEAQIVAKPDTGEAASAEELAALKAEIASLRWTKAKAKGFFKLYFGTAYEALSKDQCAAAIELAKAAQVEDNEATYEETYKRLKTAGRAL